MVVFGNLELKRRSRRKTGSNVATCQSCDVAAATFQRRDIAMFQRRDIATSRRLVNRERSTSDPTSRRLPQNHKKRWKPNFEGLKNVQTGAEKVEQ